MAVWAKIGIDIVNFYLKPELNVNVFCLTKLNLGRQREGARENQFESCESTSGLLQQLPHTWLWPPLTPALVGSNCFAEPQHSNQGCLQWSAYIWNINLGE